METTGPSVQPYEPEGIGEFIRYPNRIALLLEQIKEARSLLTVVLPHQSQRFLSAVLRVDREQRAFYIDELNPKTGHERLLPGMDIRFFTALRGVAIACHGHVQGKGERDGVGFYRIAFPEEIHYRQRRGQFRASSYGQIEVQLLREARGEQPAFSVTGTLRNISAGGLGLVVADGTGIEADSVFDRCTIQSAEWGLIRCPVRIRHVTSDRGGMVRVGAEWLEPDRLARNAIERFVFGLEREELKRHGGA